MLGGLVISDQGIFDLRKIPESTTDLDSFLTLGNWLKGYNTIISNMPNNVTNGIWIITVIKGDPQYYQQIKYVEDGITYWRRRASDGTWGVWFRITPAQQ